MEMIKCEECGAMYPDFFHCAACAIAEHAKAKKPKKAANKAEKEPVITK